MEVDFAGATFSIVDRISGTEMPVVVFVAVLPYSQCIYAEGMLRTEPEWIDVNNHAFYYFGGVPSLVTSDNCKQVVLVNKDWVEPNLNPAYQEWADYYGTYIQPAKVRRPTCKPSVEGAVGILERGIFHDLAEIPFYDIEHFNFTLNWPWSTTTLLRKRSTLGIGIWKKNGMH